MEIRKYDCRDFSLQDQSSLGPTKFSFYFGSCFLEGFPDFGQGPGFGCVGAQSRPIRFLGDFIYSDVPFLEIETPRKIPVVLEK